MDKQRYMISDAAALVDVESHVLRYWEEELELSIPRNEMGHRYYTKENITEFLKIKDWKEQGYQLKAIKMLIHNKGQEEALVAGGELSPSDLEGNTRRMEQFQSMMADIVKRAIEENNHSLGQEVGEQVKTQVIKEMNYLMREQEDASDERYRKLDELIRQSLKQHTRKEKKLFGKNPVLKPNRA